MPSPRLLHIRRLRLVRNLLLVNTPHLDRRLAPNPLLRRKPREAKNSAVSKAI
jgi:hypothetical protein